MNGPTLGPCRLETEELVAQRRADRERFRLAHYSIQGNHLHAIVEAEGTDSLGRGMTSVAIRFARAVNRALGRKGRVLADRHHLRAVGTPQQVRKAIRYVSWIEQPALPPALAQQPGPRPTDRGRTPEPEGRRRLLPRHPGPPAVEPARGRCRVEPRRSL